MEVDETGSDVQAPYIDRLPGLRPRQAGSHRDDPVIPDSHVTETIDPVSDVDHMPGFQDQIVAFLCERGRERRRQKEGVRQPGPKHECILCAHLSSPIYCRVPSL